MDSSVSLLERLAGTPPPDDWRRLLDLYQPQQCGRRFAGTSWKANPRCGSPTNWGLSLNSVLLAKRRVLNRPRQEVAGLVE
jgi:hypothetical protein